MSSRRAEKKIGHAAEFLFVGNFFKELIVTVGDLFHYDKRVAVLKAFLRVVVYWQHGHIMTVFKIRLVKRLKGIFVSLVVTQSVYIGGFFNKIFFLP